MRLTEGPALCDHDFSESRTSLLSVLTNEIEDDGCAPVPEEVGTMLSRAEATELVLHAKQAEAMSLEELAGHVGRHEVWVASAILGQATMSSEEAQTVADLLGLDAELAVALTEIPSRGAFNGEVPVDPLLYRFFEIIQVFGPAIKASSTRSSATGS